MDLANNNKHKEQRTPFGQFNLFKPQIVCYFLAKLDSVARKLMSSYVVRYPQSSGKTNDIITQHRPVIRIRIHLCESLCPFVWHPYPFLDYTLEIGAKFKARRVSLLMRPPTSITLSLECMNSNYGLGWWWWTVVRLLLLLVPPRPINWYGFNSLRPHIDRYKH